MASATRLSVKMESQLQDTKLESTDCIHSDGGNGNLYLGNTSYGSGSILQDPRN
jgi:hypothetical protein